MATEQERSKTMGQLLYDLIIQRDRCREKLEAARDWHNEAYASLGGGDISVVKAARENCMAADRNLGRMIEIATGYFPPELRGPSPRGPEDGS